MDSWESRVRAEEVGWDCCNGWCGGGRRRWTVGPPSRGPLPVLPQDTQGKTICSSGSYPSRFLALPRLYSSAATPFLIFVHLGEAYKSLGGSLEVRVRYLAWLVYSSLFTTFASSIKTGCRELPLIMICNSGQCTLDIAYECDIFCIS